MKTYDTDSAQELIDAGDVRWFDFCANRGHIPGNVARMHAILYDFVDYLNKEC